MHHRRRPAGGTSTTIGVPPMVDLILAGSFLAVAYGSFKLGSKFDSLKKMFMECIDNLPPKH